MRWRGANFFSSTCPASTAVSSSSSNANSGTCFNASGLHAMSHLSRDPKSCPIRSTISSACAALALLGGALACFDVRHHEQSTQHQVRPGKDQVRAMHSRLQHQNHNRRAVAELLDHRGNHQRSITHRIASDEEKCNLPGQRQPDESIEKSRMRNWRWILATNQIEHEVQRSDNQQAPDTGNPKHNLREFHGLIVLHFVMLLW